MLSAASGCMNCDFLHWYSPTLHQTFTNNITCWSARIVQWNDPFQTVGPSWSSAIFLNFLSFLKSHWNWLVVYLPLWKIWVRQLGWLFPTYGKTQMFQSPPGHVEMQLIHHGWFSKAEKSWGPLQRKWPSPKESFSAPQGAVLAASLLWPHQLMVEVEKQLSYTTSGWWLNPTNLKNIKVNWDDDIPK